MTITLLEKAAIILEDMCGHIEMDNIITLNIPAGEKIKYHNEKLGEFTNLAYKLLHAGRTHGKENSCQHPEWEAEVEKIYRELVGNENCPD